MVFRLRAVYSPSANGYWIARQFGCPIAAATSRKEAEAAAKRGIAVIDALVSGGTGGAIAGTLTFLAGGSDADLEHTRPVLEKMGANIFHTGAAGAGQTAKICNNMLLGTLMIGTSEAIALGRQRSLSEGALGNHAAQFGWQQGPLELQPAAVRASTPLGGMECNLYAAHSLAGQGALELSSVLKLFQKP